MRKMTKLFVALMAIFSACVLVGCDFGTPTPPTPDPVEPYNALGNFVDGGDEVYTLNTNSTSELNFDYQKADETHIYSYIYASIDENTSLEKYKKLVFTTVGNGTMMLKLECADGTPGKEVSINVTGIEASYEWNLSNDAEFLKSVTKVVIFAAPGKAEGAGQISITKLSFEEELADNFIIQTDFSNIPTNVNEYNGTDETFDFNAKWANVNDTIYTIEQDEETRVVRVDYEKSAGMEWSCIESKVKGDFTKFKYVVVVAKGTADKTLMVKAATGVEKTFKFDGTKQTFVLDISTMANDAKNSIASIVLFGSPNSTQSGSFEIHEAYMSETSPVEVEEIVKNVYNGTDETFDISEHWYDGGDSVYTVTNGADGVVVEYSKNQNQTYSSLKAFVEGKLSNFRYIMVEVTGEADKSMMLKAANGFEVSHKFTGEREIVYLDIALLGEERDAMTDVIIFAAPGSGGEGTFTIHRALFTNEIEGVEVPTTNVYDKYYEVFDVNHYFQDSTGTYTITEEGSKTVVAYNKETGSEWHGFFTTIEQLPDEFKYVRLVVKGEADTQLLVKPNDLNSYEQWVGLTGEEQVVYVALPNSLTKLLIMAEAGKIDCTGTVEILEAKLVRDLIVEETAETADLLGSLFINGDPAYTLTMNEGVLNVAYDKQNYSWASIKTILSGANEGFQTLTIEVQGEAGTQLLVKLNDDNAYQTFIDLTGEKQTVVIENLPTPLRTVHMFAAPGVENVTGELRLYKAELSKTDSGSEDIVPVGINGTYLDGGDGVYDINVTPTLVTVNYDKGTNEWPSFRFTLKEVLTNCGSLTFKVKGETGVKVLFKVNNDNSYQTEYELTGNVDTVEIAAPLRVEYLLIFVAGGTSGLTGTLEIHDSSYTEAEEDLNPLFFTFVDGGDSIYTTTGDLTEDGEPVVVTYSKTNSPYGSMRAIPSKAVTCTKLVLTISADSDVNLIIKPNDYGPFEQTVNLTATETTFTLTFDSAINLANIVFMIAPGQDAAEGTFTISSIVLE